MEQKKTMNRGMAVLLSAALVPTVGVPATAFAEELDQVQGGAQDGTSQDGVVGEGQQGAEGESTPEQATAVAEVYAENGDLRESYETLEEAVENAQPGDTVKLLDNVTLKGGYTDANSGLEIRTSVVIDGAGHTIDCGTFRGGIRVYGGDTADQRVSVVFRGATIENFTNVSRCIDTRGGYLDVTLDGSHLVAAGAGNNQPLTVGGSHDELTPITIINGSTIKAGDAGYGIITFNPVDLTVGGASSISGYAALYFKGANGSAGSAGSKVKIVEGAVLSSDNRHSSVGQNDFATVQFEDDNIAVTIDGGILRASTSNGSVQSVFGVYKDASNSVISIKGASDVSLSGEEAILYNPGQGANTLEITGGTFSVYPGDYVPDGYVVNESAGKWVVSKYVPPAPPAPQPDIDVEQRPDGSTVTTVTKPDGSQTVTTEAADGSQSVVSKDADGNVTSTEVSVSDKAAQAGEVVLPLDPSKPAADAGEAPAVEVKVPASVTAEAPVKVTVPVDADGPGYGVVVYAVDADGNEAVLPKCGVDADGNAVFEAAGDVTIKVVDAASEFPDVAGTWYGEQGVADFVSARGILTGVPQADGALRFEGDAATTRAMFVTMLHRAESCPDAEGAGFDDAAGLWFEEAAAWGEASGVVDGYGGSSFGGDDPVTREQMAVFLMRYAEHLGLDTSARADLSEFPDGSEASPWASRAMSWAVAEGLFSGRDGRLDPTDGATRAEASAVVMRFINGMYA